MASEFDTEVQTHQPCDTCGSSDALTIYEDHTYCFSCKASVQTGGEKPELVVVEGLLDGDYEELGKRRISQLVCKKFGYMTGRDKGKKVQIASYRDQHGNLCAQKVRTADKQFYTTGNFRDVQLFGQHLWKPGGKRLVLVEGEIDCLSYAMITKWAVCSVPNGAASAPTAIKRNYDFVNSFQEVVFLFDNDKQGQDAAKECAELLTPGRAAIASLPLKDCNEMLIANRLKEVTSCVFEASPFRPDGIINGKDIWSEVSKPIEVGTTYPWKSWNDVLFGIRPREILTITAGSGTGKSTVVSEIAFKLGIADGRKVGYVALEEGLGRTGLRLMGMALDKPIHLPNDITPEERRTAFDLTLGTENFFLYDHFGSLDSDNLIRKFEYMVVGCGVEFLILDHLSILVSGLGADSGGHDSERVAIDYTMTQLRSFTERTGVSLILVSHLRRAGGDKGHEGGEKVYLSHLRGSQAIAQLSDGVVSISRNMTDGDNTLEVTCLKNRYAGITGPMGCLEFDQKTGRLLETNEDFD